MPDRRRGMPPKAGGYRRPYLESSVIIAWIKGEVCDGVDRADVVDHILYQAQRGAYRIYTSALTLAEVLHRRGSAPLDDQEDEDVLAFFEHDFIEVIDIDRLIGEEANRLCRRYGPRPNDGIHIASAIRAGCDVALFWDDRVTNKVVPGIRLEAPRKLGQQFLNLPDEAGT
ncbi:MAG: type II toxin-antitoxin system VapC family toxin [Chloroflexota bacterium]